MAKMVEAARNVEAKLDAGEIDVERGTPTPPTTETGYCTSLPM